MIKTASKIESLGFYKATDIMNKRQRIRRINTGSRNLDTLIQRKHSVNSAQVKHNFIDTENTFRPERIKEIAKRFGLDEEQTLDNILVARAYTVDHLNQLLMFAAAKMYEDEFALLIVDSIMAPFRVDFSGRGELCKYI